MIEIKWNQSIIQNSATVLCISNYKQSFVNVTVIDLKTRRKNIVKSFQLTNRPTRLYQIDENNLLIGTEGGNIEHWIFDEGSCKKVYHAHPESDAGIASIIELSSKSELLRGEPYESNKDKFKLLATASRGAKEFRLWKLDLATHELLPYLKIETTIDGGIKYLMESQDT